MVQQFWQRVLEAPSAIEATADALQLLRPNAANPLLDRLMINNSVGPYVDELRPGNAAGHLFLGWPEFVGSETLQQYVMEALALATPSSQPLQPPGKIPLFLAIEAFRGFMAVAASEGRVMLPTSVKRNKYAPCPHTCPV